MCLLLLLILRVIFVILLLRAGCIPYWDSLVLLYKSLNKFNSIQFSLSLFAGTSEIYVINTYSTFEDTYLPGIEPSSFVSAVPRSIHYTTGDATEIRPSRRHAATAPVHSFSSCTPSPPPLPAATCACPLTLRP